jgi:hypothetical protein
LKLWIVGLAGAVGLVAGLLLLYAGATYICSDISFGTCPEPGPATLVSAGLSLTMVSLVVLVTVPAYSVLGRRGPRAPEAARSYLVIAAAIVIAGILISASVLVAIKQPATVTTTSTVVETVDCPQHFSNSTISVETDCGTELSLGISARPVIAAGGNQTVELLLTNDLSEPKSVNYTSLPGLPGGLDLSNPNAVDYFLPVLDCGITSGEPPLLMALIDASGDPMQLTDLPPSALACVSGPPKFSFGPLQTVSDTLSVGGYWTSPDTDQPWINATYHPLPAGVYTIVAFDPWDQLTQFSFSVSLATPG